MKIARTLSCLVAALALAAAAGAQQSDKPAGAPDMPLPKPGPEHELLKKDVGTWDATVEMREPGGPPATSQGTETSRMVGGLWLVSDFKSTMMGQPFEGHGVTGYDPARKKYVGTWVDSMSTGVGFGESTYDPASKTVTGTMEMPDAAGRMVKAKMTTKYLDDDTRVFTMSMVGPDGKDAETLKITYKRRK